MLNPPSRTDNRPLAERFGRDIAVDAPLNGLTWLGTGSGLRLVVATGDGIVRTFDPALALIHRHETHGGAILSMRRTVGGDRIITGGDDGRVASSDGRGDVEEVAKTKGRWIDHVATGPAGVIAWSEGRKVTVSKAGVRRDFEHPSTVGGLALDGRAALLGVAHYNGASLWTLDDLGVGKAPSGKPRLFGWKGSHVGCIFAPSAKFLVTIMQDNMLHGWRLSDAANLRMSGYPSRPKSLSFSANGLWLATSGAEGVVLWPFKGKDGPMGKSGEIVGARPSVVTAVAFHPEDDVIAVGYSDGCVVLARRGDTPVIVVRRPTPGAIAVVEWAAGGRYLAMATEAGVVATIDLMRAATAKGV